MCAADALGNVKVGEFADNGALASIPQESIFALMLLELFQIQLTINWDFSVKTRLFIHPSRLLLKTILLKWVRELFLPWLHRWPK